MTPNAATNLAAIPEDGSQMKIETIDEQGVVAEVREFFERKREERRAYEQVWYLNAAALNGKTQARFNPWQNGLEAKRVPSHRRYMSINIIWSKFAAKVAKMTNSEPRAIVVAANNDYQEILNARMSQQALLYLTRKGNWQDKYELAVAQAELTGKSFLWVYWDDAAMATFKNPQNGQTFEYPDGDVRVENGSAFELLVEDASESRIGKQKKIMRVSAIPIADARAMYGDKLNRIVSDVNDEDLFQFERQIADLGVTSLGANGIMTGGRSQDQVKGDSKNYVLRKELFTAPNLQYPKGRYAVVIGDKVVKLQDELPYGFHDIHENPFPVEEIVAEHTPGRFWPQTMIERMRPLQDALDNTVSKIMEDMDLSMHGKWFIPRAARIPKNSINSEPGQQIEYNHFPGMPPPQLIQPRGVSADAWRALDWLRVQFDEVTAIYPSSVGQVGDAESGFQTNLLQEAADAVYGPHKRRNERTWRGLLFKARRLMKTGYNVDRLVSITSKSQIPAVFEFHQSNIDEHAEIKVEIGSALSDLKATRLQQAMELAGNGFFGTAGTPQSNRAVLQLVDLGGIEEQVDPTHNDYQRALNENLKFTKGEPVEPPAPWQTDGIHIEVHFAQMNSSEWDAMTPEQKVAQMQHVVLHLRRHNPMMGLEIAQMLMGASPTPETQALVAELEAQVAAQQPAPAPAEEGPPPPGGGSVPPPQ